MGADSADGEFSMNINGTSDTKPKPCRMVANYFCSKNFIQLIALVLLALLAWAIAYSLFTDAVGLQSDLLAIAALFILAKIAGVIVGFANIPPMLGMLLMGVLLRNINFITLSGNYSRFAAVLRQLALVNIMLPAGLGLDPSALKRMSGMVLKLSFIPVIVEVAAMAVLSKYLLDIPWLWGLLIGLLMGAVSPAVVIPCLFELQDRGYGVDKGIHTLVIAASTIDDIACIAAFGIVIGVIFSTGSLLMQILEGPLVLAIGLGYGSTWGFLSQFVPHKDDEHVITLRTLLLGLASVLSAVGSDAIGYGGAGALGCITAAFIACLKWRKQGWVDGKNPVKANFSLLWKFFEPISYSLIGIEVNFHVLELNTVIWGSLAMILALLLRMLTSAVITHGSNLNWKENIFVAVAWIPKATVQAALGPVALDFARQQTSGEDKFYANTALIVAVISIVITAPIGAFLIMFLGPRLLHRTPPEESGRQGVDNAAADAD